MKTNTNLALIGTLLAALAAPAQAALNITVTNGPTSLEAGASTVDFGVAALNNTGPVAGPLSAFGGTLGGVTYSYTGGALFNFDGSSTLPNGISARPVGSTDNFWSIGTNPAEQIGPGVITLGAGVRYFGFLWGSPDVLGWNSISFFNGATQLATTLGETSLGGLATLLDPPDGNQSYSRYLNIYAGAGEVITKIVFTANTNAFETDNHAFISAVPEPETYAMLLAGLGLLGFVARRRTLKATRAA